MCIFLRRQTAFIYFVFVCDWLGLGFRLRGLVVRNWGQRYIIKVSVVGLGLVGGADVREGAVIFLFFGGGRLVASAATTCGTDHQSGTRPL